MENKPEIEEPKHYGRRKKRLALLWQKLKTEGWKAPPKLGHSSDAINNSVYIFGGIESGHRTNLLQRLDLGCASTRRGTVKPVPSKWVNLNFKYGLKSHQLPHPRSYHASFAYKEKLYIHGGESDTTNLPPVDTELEAIPFKEEMKLGEQEIFAVAKSSERTVQRCIDDFWSYDTIKNKWAKISTKLSPMPRKGHSISLAEYQNAECAIMFGGCPSGSKDLLNEVLYLLLDSTFDHGRGIWLFVQPKGYPPEPRYGHTSTSISSYQVAIFGGHGQNKKFLNDIFILDTTDMLWSQVMQFSGRCPPPVMGHSAIYMESYTDRPDITPNKGMLIFGGCSQTGKANDDRAAHFNFELFYFNFDERHWSKVGTGYEVPNSRYGQTMTVVKGWKFPPKFLATDDSDEEDGGLLAKVKERPKVYAVVYGGMNSVYCHPDTWIIDLNWRLEGLVIKDDNYKVDMTEILKMNYDELSIIVKDMETALVDTRRKRADIERQFRLEKDRHENLKRTHIDLEGNYARLLQAFHADKSAFTNEMEMMTKAYQKEKERADSLNSINEEAYKMLRVMGFLSATKWGPLGSFVEEASKRENDKIENTINDLIPIKVNNIKINDQGITKANLEALPKNDDVGITNQTFTNKTVNLFSAGNGPVMDLNDLVDQYVISPSTLTPEKSRSNDASGITTVT